MENNTENPVVPSWKKSSLGQKIAKGIKLFIIIVGFLSVIEGLFLAYTSIYIGILFIIFGISTILLFLKNL